MLHSQIVSLWYLSSHKSYTQTWKVGWTERLTAYIDRHDSITLHLNLCISFCDKNIQKWSIPWIFPNPQYIMVQNKFLKNSLRTHPYDISKATEALVVMLYLSFSALPVFLLLHCLVQSLPSPVDGVQFLPHPFGIQHVGLSYDVISCCVHIV